MSVTEQQGKCYKFCEGSTVFYRIEDVAGTMHSWSVQGGIVQNLSANTFSVTWGGAGSGQLSVTATSVSNITLTHTVCIEIVERPKARFAVWPIEMPEFLEVCREEEVIFTDLSEYSEHEILFWHWDFGDGTTSSERNPTHAWINEGDYTVTLTVTNECHCSDKISIEVHVRPGDALQLECPSVVCENTKAVYSAQEGLCQEYYWEVAGGEFTPGRNPHQIEVIWNRPDQLIDGYGYILLKNDPCEYRCGEFSTAKIPVVHDRALIKGKTFVCEGNQYIYTLPEWPATVFEWEFTTISGDARARAGTVPAGNTFVLDFSGEGTILLSARYTNTVVGCSGKTEPLAITVKSTTSIVWNEEPICAGTGETFQWRGRSGAIPGNWVLKRPDGSRMTRYGATFTDDFAIPGIYQLSVSASGHCDPEPISIQVNPFPSSNRVEIVGRSVVCLDRVETYRAVNTTPNTILRWEIQGGTLNNQSGEEVSAVWTANTGRLSVYRVSTEHPFCETFLQTFEVRKFDFDNLEIVQDIFYDYYAYAGCVGRFEVHYDNDIYAEFDNWQWKVEPTGVGTPIGNAGHVFVYYPYTEDAVNNNHLQLEAMKCGVSHTLITTFDIPPFPVPTVTVSSDSICFEGTVTFSFNEHIAYYRTRNITIDGIEYSFTGNSYTHTFLNATGDDKVYDVVLTVYAHCGTPYDIHIPITVYAKGLELSRMGNIPICDSIEGVLVNVMFPGGKHHLPMVSGQ
ncbi:MAG: PKD domain-containing protein [Bacteroidales bacterium]|nr:PKD domain-containing protein [Bacteroidales bacterium]